MGLRDIKSALIMGFSRFLLVGEQQYILRFKDGKALGEGKNNPAWSQCLGKFTPEAQQE
ncbi:MAG: hypothetical protein JKY01_08160 [Pseudomonadales bacterium]|nr:hypothetical protein [Pseudomonadales bacterium]